MTWYAVVSDILYKQAIQWDARDKWRAQVHAQHVPRVRFVAHANLPISLLASDEIDTLYIQV